GVAVTGNDTVVIDPATGLPIADQSAYQLSRGDSQEAVVDTLPVTIQYSGGGSGTCRSWGDPHFVTWSSKKWNFYGTGDFYLARSCDGEFAVQTRQEQCFTVSCNTAVIVKYRNSIVAFDIASRTNTDPVVVMSPTFDDGVEIFRLNAQAGLPAYRITLPNGGFVEFRASGWRNRHYINVDVKGRHDYGLTFRVPSSAPDNLFTNGGNPNGIPVTTSPAFAAGGSCPSQGAGLNLSTVNVPMLVCQAQWPDPNDPLRPGGEIEPVDPTPGGNTTFPPIPEGNATAPNTTCSGAMLAHFQQECAARFLQGTTAATCLAAGTDNSDYYDACVTDACLAGDLSLITAAYEAFLQECIALLSPVAPPTP
ncbi:Vwde, partial [Symbiodinium sp. KB8]